MDTRTNILSICSGIGGLELGLSAALAGRTRTVCYVENELGVASILAARMEDGSLDSAPIWSDIRTFDPEPWRGKVDMLAGGFPCQPHSVASRHRRGAQDPRELSGEVIRIADGLGLPVLFLENVPGILRFYWDNIRPELRQLGYELTEGLYTAAEVGAPHRRERLFILAHGNNEFSDILERSAWPEPHGSGSDVAHPERNDSRRGRYDLARTPSERQGEMEQRGLRSDTGNGSDILAHPKSISSERPVRGRATGRQPEPAAGDRGSELAYANDEGLQRRDERSNGAGESSAGTSSTKLDRLTLFPPAPDDLRSWSSLLSVMPEVRPAICRDADGTVPGMDRRLRASGNGIVPAVAARAFKDLSSLNMTRSSLNMREHI